MAPSTWSAFPATTRWLAYALLALALSAWTVMLCLGPIESAARLIDGPLFNDFIVYRDQVLRFGRNESLVSSRWYYPPFAAVLFWPLRFLSFEAGMLCWAAVQAIAVGVLIRMCWTLLDGWPRVPRMAAAAGVVLGSYPVCCCLAFGQVGILISVLALLSLADRQRTQAWLGAAGAIKIYPLLYAVGSAVRLDIKLLTRIGAWLLVIGVVVPLCWLGPGACFELFQSAFGVVLRSRGPRFDTEQTLDALCLRLFYARSVFDAEPRALLVDLPQPLAMGLAMLCTVAPLGYALWRTRARSAFDPLAISAVLVACSLLIKPGWVHYWVVFPYAQTVLLSRVQRTSELAVCLLSVPMAALPLWCVLQPGAAASIENWGLLPVAGLCVLVSVCERAARPDVASHAERVQLALQE